MLDVKVHVENIRPAKSVTAHAARGAKGQGRGKNGVVGGGTRQLQGSLRIWGPIGINSSAPPPTSFRLLGVQVGLESVWRRIAQPHCGGQ